jgi:hypothetical protein
MPRTGSEPGNRRQTHDTSAPAREPGLDADARNFEVHVRADGLVGARRLMMAVLVDALGCYQKLYRATNGRKRRLFLEAERWLMLEPSPGTVSFRQVCDCLGLDPGRIRRRLRRWRARQLDGATEGAWAPPRWSRAATRRPARLSVSGTRRRR